jgi:ethylbenzene dioxygenase beta subunit
VVTSYRGKGETDVDVVWGRRTDLLRRDGGDGALRLCRRLVLIGQSVLLAKNLNTFL